MITAWYAIVSFMLIVYVALDGRNFGAGMLAWVMAKTPEERRQVIAAIGPFWSWHEVWLIAFGGTLMAVFPELMASAFSGFYLALFLILWCYILRGISIEAAGHINDPLWQSFWDFVLVFASVLLAVLFGVAAGNLARGVPLDANGTFSMAFFTNFRVNGDVGLLDWYTVSIAAFATILLAAHGATYLMVKTEGPVHERSATLAKRLWTAAAPLFIVISLESWEVRPDVPRHAIHNPFCWFGLLILGFSIVALFSGFSTQRERWAFVGANGVIGGLLVTGAAALFPVMLHSTLAPGSSLTAYGVAASRSALLLALVWWPVGLALTITYSIFISRRYGGKVGLKQEAQGFPQESAISQRI
jgi:cytochrome d ubiquinol oxidase subunit II